MGLYQLPLSISLLGFGIGTMLANFHMWYYVGVKSRFQHAREESESKIMFSVLDVWFVRRTL